MKRSKQQQNERTSWVRRGSMALLLGLSLILSGIQGGVPAFALGPNQTAAEITDHGVIPSGSASVASDSQAVSLAAESDQVKAEARSYLSSYYVDKVPDSVLNASTIEDMLKGLNDPWAAYFTAEEYEEFANSIDNRFAGIGVHVEKDEKGILIQSVIGGSPAENAGLKAEDIITGADGQSLQGMELEQSLSLIKGEAGTKVTLTVERQGQTLTVDVIRQIIEEPTVSGQILDDGIGYIAINSFGTNTADEFAQVAQNLQAQFAQKGANSLRGWIIDLQNNTGGYLDAAIDLGSYLYGTKTAVQLKNRSQSLPYGADDDHQIDFKAPVIFLTNGYTASASELVMGAVKDYNTGLILGTHTYGKGMVQSLFQLSDGSVMKFTTYRFYSPLGNVIQGSGISPDLTIKDDSLDTARLLLSASSAATSGAGDQEDHRGVLKLTLNGRTFYVDQKQAQTPDFWQPMAELIKAASSSGKAAVQVGTDKGWRDLSNTELAQLWPAFYSNFAGVGALTNIPLNKVFTVKFTGAVDWTTVNGQTVELINQSTGERVPLTFSYEGQDTLKVMPGKALEASATYWLVIHPEIKGTDGNSLREGAVCTAKTVSVSRAGDSQANGSGSKAA